MAESNALLRLGVLYENQPPPKIALKCHPRAEDFERKLPERFSVRQALLSNPDPQNEPLTTTSAFLSLPYDILHLLLSTLSHAPSQICLLLTCKRLSLLFPAHPLHLSRHSAKYAGHLPLRVFDVPSLLAQLSPSTPPHLRLCAHCLTLRPCPPRDAGYWEGVQGCEGGCDFWIQKTGWEFKDGGWKKQVHDICPSCHGGCSLGDFGDCDGCSALGRLGDVNWERLGTKWGRQRIEEELRAGRFAT